MTMKTRACFYPKSLDWERGGGGGGGGGGGAYPHSLPVKDSATVNAGEAAG